MRVASSGEHNFSLRLMYTNQVPSSLCFQLSIKYDPDLEDLSISLNQVKGQPVGDIFINTYLIPDNRYM